MDMIISVTLDILTIRSESTKCQVLNLDAIKPT